MNGCHNREPYRPFMYVQDGVTPPPDAVFEVWHPKPVMDLVPFRMAEDCRYTHTDLGQADKGCDGCRWRASNG